MSFANTEKYGEYYYTQSTYLHVFKSDKSASGEY